MFWNAMAIDNFKMMLFQVKAFYNMQVDSTINLKFTWIHKS
jgi:hypothetical protein